MRNATVMLKRRRRKEEEEKKKKLEVDGYSRWT